VFFACNTDFLVLLTEEKTRQPGHAVFNEHMNQFGRYADVWPMAIGKINKLGKAREILTVVDT